ncbi:hypothetical protein PYCCODRAFT_1436582 [Trametes coccinea BRFM310]|uniref:F-box domain-containing protein n=1 Tax=Trametes coccinea (strain BRFM310) TaxID=1353009 RepID=A0A1Y2IJL7_TRAC3|nr:hypothetical protein PYCCODRAFT_1436582 [Trametes coccinea BRFM310]
MVSSLRRLDDDVLLQIYEELLPDRCLRTLSLTCKWVRESVKPVLFRSAIQQSCRITWAEFLPRHLWPYVQHLTFFGHWSISDSLRKRSNTIPYPLHQAVSEMPHLTSISIAYVGPSGVPWTAVATIISQPRLRSFAIMDSLNREEPPDTVSFTAAPLTCYRQRMGQFRRNRYSVSNSTFLCLVLDQPQVNQSLETLEVPSEIIPLELIPEFRWPRMKRLLLCGEDWRHEIPRTAAELFGQMPALQELVLKLGHRGGTPLLRLCPSNWTRPLPWPELKTLTLTYPDPSDPLYSLLPDTLRSLALRCWPRHYNAYFIESWSAAQGYGWTSPILGSRSLDSILRRCQLSSLHTLEIEYMADALDIDPLRTISQAFPNLTSLTIYRYMPNDTDDVPVLEIGQALKALSRLTYLYLHLDFPDVPNPFDYDHLPIFQVEEDDARMLAVFKQAAYSIARSLGPSIAIVSHLMQGPVTNEWKPFRVEGIGDERTVWFDQNALVRCGLTGVDESTPPTHQM